ncbi:MAG: transglycosylase domain-containing protein [Alphaproteobacteria bacterium]
MYESILSLVALVSTYLAPGFDNLPNEFEMALPQSSQVFAANGDLMYEFGANPDSQVSFDELGEPLINAVIAAEDKTFFEHDGFQLKALVRATAYSLQSAASEGTTRLQGGSTITQQLSKVLYTDRKASIRRKLVEAYVANKLENNFSKEQILTRYLNEVYLGGGVVGVRNAALHYYDKKPNELNTLEAATLAAMIRSPESMLSDLPRLDKTRRLILASQNIDAPETESTDLGLQKNKFPKLHISRAFGYYEDQVMRDVQDLFGKELMAQGGLRIQTGYIEEMQLASSYAIAEALTLSNATMRKGKVKAYKASNDLPAHNQFGIAADIKKVKAGWRATFIGDAAAYSQETSCLIPNKIELGRHTIKFKSYLKKHKAIRVMPIRPELGKDLTKAIKEQKLESAEIDYLFQNLCLPIIQSTLGAGNTILDPETGAIRAIVGGVDYYATKFNRASQAYRQTGSLLKPFIYTEGVEKGFRLNQTLSMTAKRYHLGGGRYWRPRNAGKGYGGFISYEGALLRSKNVPAVNLTDILGFNRVYKRLKSLNAGLGVPRELAAVLGAGSSTVRDMAGDYALFANEKASVPPLTVSRVDLAGHGKVFDLKQQSCNLCREKSSFNKFLKRKSVAKPYKTASIKTIKGVLERIPTEGTARRIGQPFDYTVFGKTGTTNDVKDAWFVGGTSEREDGDLIVGTYIGYDNPKRIASYGSASSLAAPLFKAVLAYLDGYKVEPVLVASANKPTNPFKDEILQNEFGHRDLSIITPSYSYKATLFGNVTMRKSPTGSAKYVRIVNRGSVIAPVTCSGNWCKGTYAGSTGWFTKKWASLTKHKIIGGTVAFDHKHPATAVAANFSSAVKTAALRKSTSGSFTPSAGDGSQDGTKTNVVKKKKKKRCKMKDLGGSMVEVCFNF